MRLNCILQDLFKDTPLDHICRAQIRAPNTVFGVFGCLWLYIAALGKYLSAPNMVKWGIPEKILQNAFQTRWPCVNRTPHSKVMTKSHFRPISSLDLQCKAKKCWRIFVYRSLNFKLVVVYLFTIFSSGPKRVAKFKKRKTPYWTIGVDV